MTCDQSVHEFTDSLTNSIDRLWCAQSAILQHTKRRFLSHQAVRNLVCRLKMSYVGGELKNSTVNITLCRSNGLVNYSTVLLLSMHSSRNQFTCPREHCEQYLSVTIHQGLYTSNGCSPRQPVSINTSFLKSVKCKMESMTHVGNITLHLNHSAAPVHASNFALLSEMGCYDNVSFHRVIQGFMIQSGDFTNWRWNWRSLLRLGKDTATGKLNNHPVRAPTFVLDNSR